MKSAAAHALADAIVEAAKAAPALPDEVPDDADESALAGLHARASAALRVAELAGDFSAFASFGRLLVAIEEHRRKIAPPPPVDPNEAIDIRLAAQKGRALFFETLENIIGNRGVL